MNAFIKFNRGLLAMPLPWRLWLVLLLTLNLIAVRYQIPSGEESGTVRAAGAESSRRFLPHVAMVKATDTWQSGNFRAG